jgi:hypothetical protein
LREGNKSGEAKTEIKAKPRQVTSESRRAKGEVGNNQTKASQIEVSNKEWKGS